MNLFSLLPGMYVYYDNNGEKSLFWKITEDVPTESL